MKTAILHFQNGAEITAEQNGDCFILDEKPVFPEDLSLVTVTGEESGFWRNAKVLDCAPLDGRYWFTLSEATPEELFRQSVTENIAAIEDALCEIDRG